MRSGVDHLDLVVSDLERSLEFYRALLGPLGYTRTAEITGERREHVVYLGTHHLAFAAASREAVDERGEWARQAGIEVESGPAEYEYSEGYYALFVHDPDGLKLEIVHRPGPHCCD